MIQVMPFLIREKKGGCQKINPVQQRTPHPKFIILAVCISTMTNTHQNLYNVWQGIRPLPMQENRDPCLRESRQLRSSATQAAAHSRFLSPRCQFSLLATTERLSLVNQEGRIKTRHRNRRRRRPKKNVRTLFLRSLYRPHPTTLRQAAPSLLILRYMQTYVTPLFTLSRLRPYFRLYRKARREVGSWSRQGCCRLHSHAQVLSCSNSLFNRYLSRTPKSLQQTLRVPFPVNQFGITRRLHWRLTSCTLSPSEASFVV